MSAEVPALRRSVAILRQLSASNRAVSAGTLVRLLDLPRSTVYDLLGVLEELGMVHRVESGYVLGPGVHELGASYLRTNPLQNLAAPLVRQLAEETGGTAQLAVLRGWETVYLLKESSPKSLALITAAGVRLPGYLTATGRAIMAHLPKPELLAALQGETEFVNRTGRGPRTFSQLSAELSLTRRRGYAEEDGEVTPGRPHHRGSGIRRAGEADRGDRCERGQQGGRDSTWYRPRGRSDCRCSRAGACSACPPNSAGPHRTSAMRACGRDRAGSARHKRTEAQTSSPGMTSSSRPPRPEPPVPLRPGPPTPGPPNPGIPGMPGPPATRGVDRHLPDAPAQHHDGHADDDEQRAQRPQQARECGGGVEEGEESVGDGQDARQQREPPPLHAHATHTQREGDRQPAHQQRGEGDEEDDHGARGLGDEEEQDAECGWHQSAQQTALLADDGEDRRQDRRCQEPHREYEHEGGRGLERPHEEEQARDDREAALDHERHPQPSQHPCEHVRVSGGLESADRHRHGVSL